MAQKQCGDDAPPAFKGPLRPTRWDASRRRRSVLPPLIASGLAALAGCNGAPHDPSAASDAVGAGSTQEAAALAFPGAVGHGRFAKGGKGGVVYPVTSLADRGPGTYRACVEALGPRVCVFRVSGVIRFETRPPRIINPYLTIAGETAPGDGVLLSHDGGVDGLTPLVVKNTHDVVVRHIRVRTDKIGDNRGGNDAFTIENSRNVILDHVSGSWALDEVFNGHRDNDAVTVSNSIFAEGVPRHDKCALLASDSEIQQSLSFIGNICAHNGDRNPDLNFTPGSCVEVVNNVVYNAVGEFVEVWESFGGTTANIVGNMFIAGPNTEPQAPAVTRNRIGSTGAASLYIADNVREGVAVELGPGVEETTRPTPVCPLTIQPTTAQDAYAQSMAIAGALPRDSVDLRIIEEIAARKGRIVDGPGALPVLSSTAPAIDHDDDGMSDAWERENGADPAVFDAWGDSDGDGVANLTEFLDYEHQRKLQVQRM